MVDATDNSGLSPKQVAIAIGVSESSLKRWCDKGVIPTTKTAGGHRRLSPADVIEFARKSQQRILKPYILGLPEPSTATPESYVQLSKLFESAILLGDETKSRELIIGAYVNGKSLSRIFDDVIASSFRRIGDAWACDRIDVYQERVATEICRKLINELRSFQQRVPKTGLFAIGGTIAGDNYSLANQMAEVLFLHLGWRTQSLGCDLPFDSLAQAAIDYEPNVFWISLSHITDKEKFLDQMNKFSKLLPWGTSLLLGGNALDNEMHVRIPTAICCSSMQQLEAFANTILKASTTVEQERNS